MNKRVIIYILGWVLIVEGITMQIATITSLIYHEHEGLYFLITGAISAGLGTLAVKVKSPKTWCFIKRQALPQPHLVGSC